MPTPLRPEDLRACLSHPSATIATASGPVEYADRGDGEPLLAVHGTLGGCDQGLVASEFFRVNGFRIIAPSRPGYLGTPLTTGRTPAEQADALAALMMPSASTAFLCSRARAEARQPMHSPYDIRGGSSGCCRWIRYAFRFRRCVSQGCQPGTPSFT